MSTRLEIVLVAGLLIAAIAFSYLNRVQSKKSAEAPAPAPSPTAMVSEAPVPEASPTPSAKPSAAPSVVMAPTGLVNQIPSVSSLREDVEKNPHEPPKALLRFGADIGERMEVAKKSEGAARDFLPELKSCTEQPEGKAPVQARALCLVSARELADQWPSLKDDVDGIFEKADPKSVQLASMLKSSH